MALGRIVKVACVASALGPLACMVGPDYVRPPLNAPVPAAYKEAGDWKPARPNDELPRGPWWTLLHEPRLDTLEQQLELQNQNLRVAEANYRAALAGIGIARAGLWPTLSASAAITRSHGTPQPSAGDTTTFSLPAELSWEADLWGRIRRGVEASRDNAAASAGDLESARLSAQSALAQSYLALQTLDAQRALLDRALADFEKSLELTRNRYASGIAARSDVLQAETQLASTRAQAIDLGVQRAQLEHAIAVLIGQPASSFSLPAMPLVAEPPAIPAELPSELLERRPDVAAAERRMAAANAQIGVVQAAWYPRFSLSASLGFLASSLGKLASLPSLFWSVGPTLSETAFDGGLRSAQMQQARAGYDAAVASYRQTALGAFQEVEDNLAALRVLEQEAAVRDQAVEAAQQVVTITNNEYRAGTAGYLDVLVAQTTALDSERAAISVRGQRLSASVLLIQALGGDWKPPREAATANDVSHSPPSSPAPRVPAPQRPAGGVSRRS